MKSLQQLPKVVEVLAGYGGGAAVITIIAMRLVDRGFTYTVPPKRR